MLFIKNHFILEEVKNRLLIFSLSSLFIGILFSFSMFSSAPANQNSMVWQSMFSIEQKADENSAGKKKDCKEFKVKQTDNQKITKISNKDTERNVFIFSLSSLHSQSSILNEKLSESRTRADLSSIEEIRNTKMRI